MRLRSAAALAAAVVLLAACGGAPQSTSGGIEVGAPTAAGAVERFLAHAAEGDTRSMGWVFGNVQGPIAARDPAANVQRRMVGLAAGLRHESYSLTGVVPVPGRAEARAVGVQLRRAGRTMEVPFTVVQGPQGRWFVEVVALEAATGG